MQLITQLTAAWQAEQRLSTQIRQIIPALPYEQFRQCLDVMARDDEQHADLLQERLAVLGGTAGGALKAGEGSENNLLSSPWRRLQRILREKRELYEGYRQEANATDDLGLQSLLGRLREDEERHQDLLIDMLIRLDAHVHETIT
jgi:rubrerythrin